MIYTNLFHLYNIFIRFIIIEIAVFLSINFIEIALLMRIQQLNKNRNNYKK